MKDEKELGKSCFYYEMFMERAYGKYEVNIPGRHFNIMKNLIFAEKGRVISVESVAHFEEQLIEIKKHMEDALVKYMGKPNVPTDIIDELKGYKDHVGWSVSSEELMHIVFKTIDLTVSTSIDMEG
ncbi:MAG TPA: hypothetical protein VFG54_20790 [Prolixibacteraceae bacterium]|nr:hypothetical protein [Prolixibacteraceae bacterium]